MTIILMLVFGFLGMIIGGLIGAGIGEELGAMMPFLVFGALAGLFLGGWLGRFLGKIVKLPGRVDFLEQELKNILKNMQPSLDSVDAEKGEAPVSKKVPEEAPKAAPIVESEPIKPEVDAQIIQSDSKPMEKRVLQPPPPPLSEWDSQSGIPAQKAEITEPDSVSPDAPNIIEQKFSEFSNQIKAFFTQGNIVARLGIIVLFFGVAFLLKYATTRYHVAIEYRFITVALCAMAMTFAGFYMRERRRVFSLLLQGGGIGILYMTVFTAARMYSLLPMWMAFCVMVVLVALSGAVAVFQNARSTAFMAAVGGFIAPVLASTGGEHHVFLFSYYAILSAGILGISWFKAWRELNIVGFAFVLGVGAIWGAKYYEPRFFSSVEPFLILFFVFYEIIAVLYAFRQPPKLKGIVDSTLIFGTPIAIFALQVPLMQDIDYGLAYCALFASIFYVALAKFLWRREATGMRVLTESFLSLCVVFASLAIPLALSGMWTSAIWALEGAALVWVGIRQQRLRSRIFGLLLQIGAAVALLVSCWTPANNVAVFNSIYIDCVVIGLGALFSSFMLWRHKSELTGPEKFMHAICLVWGLAWWFGAGVREIFLFVGEASTRKTRYAFQLSALIMFFSGTASIMHILISRLKWRPMGMALIGYAPALAFFLAVGLAEFFYRGNPMAKLGYVAWIYGIGLAFFLMKRHSESAPAKLLSIWHIFVLWIVVILASVQLEWLMNEMIKKVEVWQFIAWGIAPCSFALILMLKGQTLGWPVSWNRDLYRRVGLGSIFIFIWLWCLAGVFTTGKPSPLPYLPLVNPLEIVQAFVLVSLFAWALRLDDKVFKNNKFMSPRRLALCALWATVFLCANAVLARTVHYFGGVRFSSLGSSMLFHAALSIFWALCALVVMGIASKKGVRFLWFVGAGLIGVVTLKLFFVDLSHAGAVSRVVSFLGAGILMLVVGYTSPLPPQILKEDS